MSKKKFADMLLATSTLKPAAERHEKPDLSAPPSTGMGLTTQRIQLQQKVTDLQKRIVELEANGGEGGTGVKRVALALVEPNPWQPRRTFDVAELAESIKLVGVIHPIVIRKNPNKEGFYQLVAGERRLRASQVAGLVDIPVIEMDLDDASMAVLALTENISRTDLSDFEIGMSIVNIQKQFPEKKAFAEAIGIKRTALYRFLAFGSLPDFMISDLSIEPSLLGGTVALDIANLIEKSEQKAELLNALKQVWAQVKDGELNQTNILSQLKNHLNPNESPTASAPAVDSLFLGGKKVGTIKKDANIFMIKLKSTNLSVDQENQLRTLLSKFFK